MAEELQFTSRTDNKRKYDESPPPPPPPRRATGFSAPIVTPDSQNPNPNSYNSVPPPADEIQIAKQKAQEIAARLFSSAEAKRPRVDNGIEEGPDKGFSSAPADIAYKSPGQQIAQFGALPSARPVPYGFQGASKKIDIPNGRVGVIIGKGGDTIRYLQLQSGAKIQVTRDMDSDPTSQTRLVELIGTSEQISKAEQLINDVLSEAESGGSGGSGILAARKHSVQVGVEQFAMTVPNNKVGLIIGKGGETIKNMQARSGARIQLIPLHLPVGDTSSERTVQMNGTKEQIEMAKQLVNEVISENRPRNPTMGGGYSQQGYRPPRPPTNWGPPGPPPVQQPGYGYMQPGAYPGPAPQYNMQQTPYGSYPPQQTTGWDQSPVPPTQQTPQGGAAHDYYGQQPQQQPTSHVASSNPTDPTNYGYSQPPTANYSQQVPYGDSSYSQPPSGQQQGYSQDGYIGAVYPTTATPQPSYLQQQSNPQSGYEQQQGYSSVPAYVNPNQDGGATGAVSYASQALSQPPTQQIPPPAPASALAPAPAPAPAPVPPVTQQGYSGPPPATTPPSYASQGYSGPPTSQPGYPSQPPAQTGYGQSPLAAPSYGPPQGQKLPPAQPVYGQTPPATQGSYAQLSPVQQSYTHSQPPPTQSSYVQSDPSHHRAPPVGYGPSQSGGYAQTYGAPPVTTQPGYGQQQPPYNDSYSGYQQPPLYSTDGAPSGNPHGTYDAPPGAQPPVQTGVPKASPST